jgi:hypothetical protein
MLKKHWSVVVAAGLGLVAVGYVAGVVRAQGIPTSQPLVFTGRLTSNGQPVTDPGRNLVVRLYQAGTTVNPVCVSSGTPVRLDDGHFKVDLPDLCVTAVQSNNNLEAEVALDNVTIGRTRINAVPYAVEAVRAGTAVTATGALDDRLRTLEGRSVVRVAHSGVDVDSGAALRDALALITDAAAARPYLIQLDPGVYDLGTTPLLLKPYVGLRGADRTLTILQSHGSTNDTTATITAANNAPLRDLTVRNAGGQAFSVGILAQGASVDLFQVAVVVDAPGSGARAYGLRLLLSPSSSVRESHIQVHGDQETQAVKVTSGALTISNTTVTARSNAGTAWGLFPESDANVDALGISVYVLGNARCNGLDARGANTRVALRASTIGADATGCPTETTAILNTFGSTVGMVGGVVGGTVSNTVRCTGTVNGSLVALGANCQ